MLPEPQEPPDSSTTENFLMTVGLVLAIPLPIALSLIAWLIPGTEALPEFLRSGLYGMAALLLISGVLALLLGHFRALERADRFDFQNRWLLGWVLLAFWSVASLLHKGHYWPLPPDVLALVEKALGLWALCALLSFWFYWITEMILRWQRSLPIGGWLLFWAGTAAALFFAPLL